MQATQWRGNPAGRFGIPDYDTDWIAASALAGLPRDDTFSFTGLAGSGTLRQASPTPSPLHLSLRATQWRGNPAGRFGIPHYGPDWIATSAPRAFLAMTPFSFTGLAGSGTLRQASPTPSLLPCHCEPHSGVAIHADALASRTTIPTGSPHRSLRAFLAMTLSRVPALRAFLAMTLLRVRKGVEPASEANTLFRGGYWNNLGENSRSAFSIYQVYSCGTETIGFPPCDKRTSFYDWDGNGKEE